MILQNLCDHTDSSSLADFTFPESPSFSPSYGRILERIEIIRSQLRWASELGGDEIEKLFALVSELREDTLLLSRRSVGYDRNCPIDFLHYTKKEKAPEKDFVFDGVFGENPDLLECLEIARKSARTELPFLIEGESGTGKELLAKIIHANSERAEGPFISLNCGAITPTLLESELFGHVKGAFTGAAKDRKGKFEAATDGTIFLDEIGELPLESQVKLLRVLESGEIQRVGSDEAFRINARVVAATNRQLFEMTEKGRFREDLYYRLSIISVCLPPLRQRRDEIPMLIDYFRSEAAEMLKRPVISISERLWGFLLAYSYKGNIRELRNMIYRLTCLADDVAHIRHLPGMVRASVSYDVGATEKKTISLEDVRKQASDAAETQFLKDRLRETKGNVSALAKMLEMNRSYVQTLLKKHGINAKNYKPQK